MNLYYKNETLFIHISSMLTVEFMENFEQKIFRILDDYGIDKIIISIDHEYDKNILNVFKRNYYHKYKGFLWIK